MLRAGINGNGDGQNLVWTQMVAIVRAILIKDYDTALRVFKAMWSAVVVTTGDGIQPDGSYHFHNKILYSGGYGGDTAIDVTSYANISQGTPFVMPNTTIQVAMQFHPHLRFPLDVFFRTEPYPNA